MKFVIGTVQWGIKYGISNDSGIPKDIEIKKILNYANKNKISYLDTASVYGNSEKRIGKLSKNNFKIITKIKSLSNKGSIKMELNKSIKNLNSNSIYACLIHDIKEILSNSSKWNQLKYEKERGKISKIGFSLYNPNELDLIIKKGFIPDIVQLPYSVLDRKFEPYFRKIRDLGSEIHVRSIFLQGLYFLNVNTLSDYFNPIKKDLIHINKIAEDLNIDLLDLLIQFVLFNNMIDKVIVGIDNLKQLKQIKKSSKKKNIYNKIYKSVEDIKVENKELLNPSNW